MVANRVLLAARLVWIVELTYAGLLQENWQSIVSVGDEAGHCAEFVGSDRKLHLGKLLEECGYGHLCFQSC